MNVVKVKVQVSSCRKCPNGYNNAQLHDDAFTSEPAHIYWRCREMPKGQNYIDNPWEVPANCPLTIALSL